MGVMRHITLPTITLLALSGCAHLEAAGAFGELIYDRCGTLDGVEQRKCIERVVAHAAECAVQHPPEDADADGDTDGDTDGADPGE